MFCYVLCLSWLTAFKSRCVWYSRQLTSSNILVFIDLIFWRTYKHQISQISLNVCCARVYYKKTLEKEASWVTGCLVSKTADVWQLTAGLPSDSGCVRQWRGCAGNETCCDTLDAWKLCWKSYIQGNLNIIALSCLSPALHGETSGEGRLYFLNQRDASEGNVLTGNDGINLINTNTASDDNSSGAKQ